MVVAPGDVAGYVLIEATDTNVDEILGQLGQAHGFQTDRLGGGTAAKVWSGRFEGPLEDALAKLLVGQNYLVVHSANAKSGIATIKLFGPSTAVNGERAPVQAPPVQPLPVAASVAPKPASAAKIAAPAPAVAQKTAGKSVIANAAGQPSRASDPSIVANAPTFRRRGGTIQ